MTRIAIMAWPLLDRWSLTTADRKDRADWPPSPDTLFSALVASAASLGNACHPALYWLESLGNPAIEADLDPPILHGVRTYDPVADVTMWQPKSRKARMHNRILHPGTVTWSWKTDACEHLPALQEIAENVAYIGSSRGPVLACAKRLATPLSDDALVPVVGRGWRQLRGIYPGRLDELESAFQRGERPQPTQTVGYVQNNKQPILSRWEQMIPLRRVTGHALQVSHTVPVTEAVRQAIMDHLPDAAPGVLTGHATDGTSLAGEHVAIVPLPRVYDEYADGTLYGVGLMLPRGVSDEDYGVLLGGLARWIQAGGKVRIGPIEWTMALAHGEPLKSLRANRYEGETTTWATVTPVVFDRHPRRNLGLLDVVASMCKEVGLPAPREVEAAPHGVLKGTAPSTAHGFGHRTYLRNKYTTHLRVTWSQRVPGPVLLGRGRYFGMGVMLPEEKAA
jgi:CRISPR-associated protein Csb2